MASDARKRTEAQLERKREAEEAAATARLLGAAAQLKERSEAEGVLAFLRKPVERLRPNERYLQNTLNNVHYANRRADEAEMWERLELARARERRERRHRIDEQRCRRGMPDGQRIAGNASDSDGLGKDGDADEEEEGATVCDAEEGEGDDRQIEEFLRRKRARGRGAVGSRMEETGPYLAEGKEGGGFEAEVITVKGPQHGPEAPSWVRVGKDSAVGSSSDEETGVELREKRKRKKSSKRKEKVRKNGSSDKKNKSKKEKKRKKTSGDRH